MSSEKTDLELQLATLNARLDKLTEEVSALQAQVAEGTRRASMSSRFTISSRAERVLRPDPFMQQPVIPPSPPLTNMTIVGGEETTEFPDCCAVGNAFGYYCSGVLIAPNLVLTAGHCTRPVRVFLKGADVNAPADGEEIAVVPHLSSKHPSVDLRVLVLARDATVAPRHVARGPEIGNPKVATLVGFGRVDLAGRLEYGKKRVVEVPITSLDCSLPEEATTFGCKVGVEMIAGHRGLLKGTCEGDSGGPLYIKAQDGSFSLLGIISRAIKNRDNVCGDGGICVRVDMFLDWIREKTGLEPA